MMKTLADMRKPILFSITLFCVICFTGAGPVQAGTVGFLDSYQSLSRVKCQGNDLAIGPAQNSVLLTGYFSGRMILGMTPFDAGNDSNQVFTAKFGNDSQLLWLRTGGGTGIDQGNGVAVDSNDNVVVVGTFFNSATFSGTTLSNTGRNDMFVVKYDRNGTLLWARNGGATSGAWGGDVAVDGSGNVFVAGKFMSTGTLFGGAISGDGHYDVFVAKYNASGTLQWAKSGGGSGADEAAGIATDASGNVYVTGWYYNAATFGTVALPSGSASYDAFLVKYNPANGSVLWGKGIGASGADLGRAVAVDGSGNVYLGGEFSGTANIGSTPLVSSGGADLLLVSYTSSGTQRFALKAGGSGNDSARALSVDSAGNAVVAGSFSGSVTIGETSLTSSGGSDILVAAYSSAAGAPLYALQAGGAGDDTALAAQGVGSGALVAGQFSGVATFGGRKLVSLATESELFLAAIGTPPPLRQAIAGDYTGDDKVGLDDVVGLLRLLSGNGPLQK